MSLLYPGIDAALQDASAVSGTTFKWQGRPYACVINAEQNTLVTSKSLFGATGFPAAGDAIIVNNIRCQVQGVANAIEEFVPGGLSGENLLIDDPNNASLIISFSSFMSK